MWSGSIIASALAAVAMASPSPVRRATTACNNSPSLCSKKYNEVTYLGAHNSYALRDDSTGNSIAGNQYLNATKALDAGLRLLQVQTHEGNATLELCHTSCSLLDAGPLTDWLADINTWLGANPNEVVTLLMVNGDSAPASTFASALESSGISEHAYSASVDGPSSSWPTLQTMIDDDKRVVTFVTNVDYSSQTPTILPEFDYVFETAFDVTDISGFNCTLDRPSDLDDASTAIGSGYMGLINHFKYQAITTGVEIPDVDTLDTVNSNSNTTEGAIGTHLKQCSTQWGSAPTFALVDFWNDGEALEAVDAINAVTDATGRTAAESGSADDTSAVPGAAHGRMNAGALLVFVAASIMMI
ncbi:PI-PLC X domain-containing protein [Geosmithia morbida]|uniref:PI-PLC X domain-containing protein n=1 Tax=Geosmithia morbida TaxID=1094350 RepID=A0A9P5CZA0_9HYPO|nr:PI-PLC X domain-containing protein [Geosmithia morbida]KAF4121338.1 PI-PLC X domain-containing protein [Geosmithia morbida]